MQVRLYFRLLLALLFAAPAVAQTPASALLEDLTAKRGKLPGVHQEFEVTQTLKTATHKQGLKRQLIVDVSQKLWREKSVTGSGRMGYAQHGGKRGQSRTTAGRQVWPRAARLGLAETAPSAGGPL